MSLRQVYFKGLLRGITAMCQSSWKDIEDIEKDIKKDLEEIDRTQNKRSKI